MGFFYVCLLDLIGAYYSLFCVNELMGGKSIVDHKLQMMHFGAWILLLSNYLVFHNCI